MTVTVTTRNTPQHAMMRKSAGASYSQWLAATDRWLCHTSNGGIQGTWCLVLDGIEFVGLFERDMLPSEAAEAALNHRNGVGSA